MFVLIPKRKPEVMKMLYKNKPLLKEFLANYVPQKEEEDFPELKSKLLKKLDSLDKTTA